MKSSFVFRMFVVAVVLVSGFFSSPFHSAAEETMKAEFRVFDGYFQGRTFENSEPLHLLHESVGPYRLELGEKFRIWLLFEVKNSPCGRRAEDYCIMLFEVVDSKNKVWQTWKQDFRIDDSTSFGVDVPGKVSREAAEGDGVIRLRFEFDNKEIFGMIKEIRLET